jgi:hypothetical protein
MATVGEYLKNARKARNLSVREVAIRTKISPKYIQCIEDDDYGQLPQGPYIKGYISAYALQVCGECDKALKLYASCHHSTSPATAAAPPEGEDAAINTQPLKDERQSAWRAGVSRGFSIFRRLHHAFPPRTWRSRAADYGAQSPLCDAVRRNPLPSIGRRAADRMANHRKSFLKRVLFSVLVGAGGAVLVFAGVGIYHVFIYANHPTAARADRQVAPTAQTRPLAANGPPSPLAPRSIHGETATRSQPPAKATAAAGGGPAVKGRAPSSSAAPVPGQADRAAPFASDGRPAAVDTSSQPPAATAAIALIKARVCTSVDDRMPVGAGDAFPWTARRIYVWSLVGAADPPARVHHIYYHGNNKVGDVVLTIGSAYWRTWSYQSLGEKRLQGAWRVDIASDDGQVLRSLPFKVQ